jgi:hypothetical protein
MHGSGATTSRAMVQSHSLSTTSLLATCSYLVRRTSDERCACQGSLARHWR